MFSTSDIRIWDYPSDSIGFAIDWQISFLHDFIFLNESKLEEERNKFLERIRNNEFLVDIDDDGLKVEDPGKDLIESSLDEYKFNSRKFILIQLIALFEEYLYILYSNAKNDLQIEDENKYDKGVKRYMKYFKNIGLDESKYSKDVGLILDCINLRHFYTHKPDEARFEEERGKILGTRIKNMLCNYYNITEYESILIKDVELLYELSKCINNSLFSISNQLHKLKKART